MPPIKTQLQSQLDEILEKNKAKDYDPDAKANELQKQNEQEIQKQQEVPKAMM